MRKQQLPYFASDTGDFVLYKGDCQEIVATMPPKCFDMVFADPPYFLSNGGISIQSGKQVCVNKGEWDESNGYDDVANFNYEWLRTVRSVMKDEATIWVCGTFHNIFSVANALTELDYRVLNAITWQKSNPPPNLSCRFFKHSTEIMLWARKSKRTPHRFNYELMHRLADNRQMTDVWRMPAIARWEKTCGKHPTQKPIALVVRSILSCTCEGACILDPFVGSGTTGIAANIIKRNFVGIDSERNYLDLAIARRQELELKKEEYLKKIPDLQKLSI